LEPISPQASPGSPPDLHQDTLIDEFDENLDADHDDAPLRLRTLSDVIGPAATPSYAMWNLNVGTGDDQLMMISAKEPASVAQAAQELSWRRAMEEELRAIEENGSWTLTDLPPGRKAIGLKWVFKVKKDELRAVVRHKARLVVKGYAQCQGIDFEEVYAPIARMEVVRLLLALAAEEGWQVHRMDVKAAFLNGDLQEEVYVQQPPGFNCQGLEHKVLTLHKVLYGLQSVPLNLLSTAEALEMTDSRCLWMIL
jgi:hypothetical protein